MVREKNIATDGDLRIVEERGQLTNSGMTRLKNQISINQPIEEMQFSVIPILDSRMTPNSRLKS
jgi:hypothetical protein